MTQGAGMQNMCASAACRTAGASVCTAVIPGTTAVVSVLLSRAVMRLLLGIAVLSVLRIMGPVPASFKSALT